MTFAAATQPTRLPGIGTTSLATNSMLENSGNSGATRATFYGRLKDFYLPAWDDHIHEKTMLGPIIMKKKGVMGGTRALSSVMNQLPQSAGVALQEYDDMPTPSPSNSFNPQLIARGLYSRLRWSINVRNAARAGDKAAWADPQREDIEGAKKQFDINIERMLFVGNRNILATISAAASGTTQTAVARNSRTSATSFRFATGTHLLRVNQAVAIVQATAGNLVDMHAGQVDTRETSSNVRYIKSIDAPNSQFVLSSTIGGAASNAVTTEAVNQVVIPWQSRLNLAEMATGADVVSTDSGMSAINGLGNLIVSNVEALYVLGQSRSTYDSLNGRMSQNGGTVRSFDERFISLAIDRIADEGRGDEPDHMLMHACVRREYVRETAGDRRFEPIQQGKGYKKLAFTANNTMLPIETSRDCPPGSVFIIDSSTFGYFEECPLKMLDDGERFVTDKAAHEIIMVKSGNVACVAPFNNATVEDIAFDVTALTA